MTKKVKSGVVAKGSEAGDGFEIELQEFLRATQARKRCDSDGGVVFLGRIKSGTVVTGQSIAVYDPTGAVIAQDTIARIENNGQGIPCANVGMEVGICLQALQPYEVLGLIA